MYLRITPQFLFKRFNTTFSINMYKCFITSPFCNFICNFICKSSNMFRISMTKVPNKLFSFFNFLPLLSDLNLLILQALTIFIYLNVFCKTFLHKIAKTFCRSLQLHFIGTCQPFKRALQTFLNILLV